ncbi:MAG: IreB family regulatory phosphoprotein [Ruminococcus sp.]|jgi:uncharacterized protein (UPF0297 family)|nr:IreB family regulatory phosphoprotein [Ruminococcus sp.]
MNMDQTMLFSVTEEKERLLRTNVQEVGCALLEKGYNPVNQIVGYILSEDPTYITTHNGARSKIMRLDRDELLQDLVRVYLDSDKSDS